MINTCIVCGTIFKSPNKKNYCSSKCYYKSNYIKQEIKHICIYCGKEFISKKKTTKFCSKSCNTKYNRKEKSETKYCKTCGKPLDKLIKGQLYCNKECKNKWLKENPRYNKICPLCNKKFKTNNKSQIYCSKECVHESLKKSKKHRVGICKNCGKEFEIKRIDVNTFCSRDCSFQWLKGNALANKELKKIQQEKEKTEKNKLKSFKLTEQKQKYIESHTKICIECGTRFIAKYGRKCCSVECRKKRNNRLQDINRRHKLKENGKINWSITLKKLYKRDKGICHLCGKKVDMNLDINDNWYGSIDHVIPVSKGGTHTWDNVKLAHRKCNSLKRDNIYVEDNKGQFKIFI